MIQINGMSFDVRNGQVFVNGKRMVPADGSDFGVFRSTCLGVSISGEDIMGGISMGNMGSCVSINGDEGDKDGQEYTLHLDKDGRVGGNVDGSLTVTGNDVILIIEGRVGGSVNTSGPVTCGRVGGSVNTSGNVTCDRIGGSVNAATINKR